MYKQALVNCLDTS